MHHLYHGSGYQHTELKPGIHYTGKKVEWDKTESNEWLYATTLMEEAISQGLASVVEKHFAMKSFKASGSTLEFVFDGVAPKHEELLELTVYLYKLDWHKDIWVQVNNLHNGMTNEYKTKEIIPATMIDHCAPVDLKTYLSRKTVVLSSTQPTLNW